MNLIDALTTIENNSSWGIWAEPIEGKLSPESPARFGQIAFENGGLADEKVFVGSGDKLSYDRLIWTGGDWEHNEEWAEQYIEYANEALEEEHHNYG